MHRMQSGGWPYSKVGRDSYMHTIHVYTYTCVHAKLLCQERPFVRKYSYLKLEPGKAYEQGYVSHPPFKSVQSLSHGDFSYWVW